MRQDVRLAGVGGQGLILAGMILGEAAAVYAGLCAVQTQTYAPLVRGAPSMSEVIISSEPIDFPAVQQADLLLALVDQSWSAYAQQVRPGGTIIVPDRGVTPRDPPPSIAVHALPLHQAAQDAGAPPIAITLVGLGALVACASLTSLEALDQAVRLRVPRDTREANLRALHAGYALGAAVRT